MMRLSARRLAQVCEFLRETYRARNLDEFATTVPVAITRLIGADIVTFSEVNLGRKRAGWHDRPNGVDTEAGGGQSLATPVDVEVGRHLNLQYQLAFALDPTRPTMVGLALHRASSDFSEEDRLTANVLRGHLIQAYLNAEAVTQSQRAIGMLTEGIERSGRATILLSRERAILEVTPKARRWLASYFVWPRDGSGARLPEALDAWLDDQAERPSDAALIAHPLASFSVQNARGKLIVRAIVQDEHVLLLLDERCPLAADDPVFIQALASLGLGRRESQVLAWVAQGKTNPEIALILGVSSRTVQTHLNRIYRKLDVQTRAAATAKAMEARAVAVETR